MKPKHIAMRIQQCLALARLSPCPRRKYGAVAIDPVTNVIISEGYNGTPRGSRNELCGGSYCRRDGVPVAMPPDARIELRDPIASGTRYEIGCIHSEANVVTNAARAGRSLNGAWLICTGLACLGCARLIHAAGIVKVITIRGSYAAGDEGAAYLRENGVEVEEVDPPNSSGDVGPFVDPGGR